LFLRRLRLSKKKKKKKTGSLCKLALACRDKFKKGLVSNKIQNMIKFLFQTRAEVQNKA